MSVRRIGFMALVVCGLLFALAMTAFAADGGRPFSTSLTGEAEVTAAGVPNQGDLDGIGNAEITLNPGLEQVCFELSAEDITLPAAAAHIHVGPATSTGPVVVGLAPPGADGTSSGCVDADRDLIKAIIQNPENYYVNVHTSDFPAGALRGQLGR
ncbi:MAG: CHRD domain-containing protein [Vicinamibacterales bacterium]